MGGQQAAYGYGAGAGTQQQFVQAVAGQGGGVPDVDKTRRMIGFALWALGVLVGALLLLIVFVVPALMSSKAGQIISTMGLAAVVAYIPVGLYLFVPWVIDRYDPEPWWALAGVFIWGACFATGVSGVINSVLGSLFGEMVGAAISAPIFEEATKGMAILGMVIFLRREFDGVVDGIIYATFAAIGFAATENIIYYTRGELAGQMGQLFVMRGVLTPWIHPLFTSMTGIGFGLAREHGAGWAKLVFPLVGYGAAVFLHAWWNGMLGLFGATAFVLNLVLGICMALAFFVIICVLVWRKGRTIRKFLEDEVLIGTITQEELELICSPVGRLTALFSWRGWTGRKFIRAGARLALHKWHTARAMKGQKLTISMDFIAPLRQELGRLRAEMASGARAR
ncbi:MAG: PrsW family intramembrane metalloprotease [Deltaproteobacteria bacterium]|nr:PrsW family intramembrane metalloprotease [Deltaproteobacteria bacterium]